MLEPVLKDTALTYMRQRQIQEHTARQSICKSGVTFLVSGGSARSFDVTHNCGGSSEVGRELAVVMFRSRTLQQPDIISRKRCTLNRDRGAMCVPVYRHPYLEIVPPD